MNYVGMPLAMWALFATSFRTHLQTVVGLDAATAKAVTHKAKKAYREILSPLPDFEKGDQFQMNLVNCAMLCAFVLSTPQRPDVQTLTDFYARAMMTRPMRWFCRQSGKGRFSEQSMAKLRKTAQLRAADRNPYSWNMEYYPCPDGSGYEARFTQCGICTLMRELGLYDLTPALCRLDYTMNDVGGASRFARRYTIASGGPYCDCCYYKK